MHPPGHDVKTPDLGFDDYQTWEKINQSIETAKQRRTAERAQNRHTPGISC